MQRVTVSAQYSSRLVLHSTVVIVALGLCACTTTPARTAAVASGQVGDVVQDGAYVEQVERIARRRGIGVTWINVPNRRLAASDRQ